MRRSGHAHHRLTHEQNRLQTCVLCWRRGGRKGSKAVGVRPVTTKLAATLRRVTHHTTYDLECPSHPGGICTTDYKQLLNLEKLAEGRGTEYRGKDPRTEWRKLKLSDIVVPDPDLSSDECSCPMCHLGYYNPVAGGIGRKKFMATLDIVLSKHVAVTTSFLGEPYSWQGHLRMGISQEISMRKLWNEIIRVATIRENT